MVAGHIRTFSTYTITIRPGYAWADSAMTILDDWSSYRGGLLNRFYCTEKRTNKAKYLTSNSIRLTFAKQTSMPSPVTSLGYIKCYSFSNPKSVKSQTNSIKHNSQKICSSSRRPKTILEIRKKNCISLCDQQACSFFKDFPHHRKKTKGVVVFSRSFPNILKYRDH